MSVFCRKGVWYVAWYPNGRLGPYIRTKLPLVKSEAEARQAERIILEERNRSRGLDEPSPQTNKLRDLWNSYAIYKRLHRQPRTADDIEVSGKHFLRVFGNVPVEALNDGHVTLYKQTRLREGVKARTVNKELSWLGGFLKYCRKKEHKAPKLEIEKLPYRRPMPVILTPQECLAVLNECSPFYRAFFGCCYLVGLRLREVSRLRWDEIDWANRSAVIRGKGGGYRMQALPKALLGWLQAIKPELARGYVFARAGKPVYWVATVLKKAVDAAGIAKRVSPHTFRHSMGAHMVSKGENLRTIQAILGHSSIAMTEWYTQVSLADKQRASDSLAESVNDGQQRAKPPKPRKPPKNKRACRDSNAEPTD